eukprot:GHVN01023979.1.p1 GENE.GHVN01023979.1~~GHVN01023979.1.p1  ORF type:complete len:126 (-),score=12.36 GHVN01023979.1:90-467(-)
MGHGPRGETIGDHSQTLHVFSCVRSAFPVPPASPSLPAPLHSPENGVELSLIQVIALGHQLMADLLCHHVQKQGAREEPSKIELCGQRMTKCTVNSFGEAFFPAFTLAFTALPSLFTYSPMPLGS